MMYCVCSVYNVKWYSCNEFRQLWVWLTYILLLLGEDDFNVKAHVLVFAKGERRHSSTFFVKDDNIPEVLYALLYVTLVVAMRVVFYMFKYIYFYIPCLSKL